MTAELFLLALRAFLPKKKGSTGSNPNPDWHDPGTPEGWYNPDGSRNYEEPGSYRQTTTPASKPKSGISVDAFKKVKSEGTFGVSKSYVPPPSTGLTTGRKISLRQ